LAVDVVLMCVRGTELRVRLIRRPDHPFAGTWTLPGTFVGLAEDLPDAAARVLRDKLGLTDVHVEPFQVFGAPGRDPRSRIVTVAHVALVPEARGDLAAGRWGAVEVPWAGDLGGDVRVRADGAELALGFDHAVIIGGAVAHLRRELGETGGRPAGVLGVAQPLLPTAFTLRRVQVIHEALVGRPVNKDSFRRKILAEGRLEATGEREASVGHRPAELYRFRP
jgi:8-oxo-dGTP diphosphatase